MNEHAAGRPTPTDSDIRITLLAEPSSVVLARELTRYAPHQLGLRPINDRRLDTRHQRDRHQRRRRRPGPADPYPRRRPRRCPAPRMLGPVPRAAPSARRRSRRRDRPGHGHHHRLRQGHRRPPLRHRQGQSHLGPHADNPGLTALRPTPAPAPSADPPSTPA